MDKQSILDHVVAHVEQRGDETAALVKQDGRYVPITWHSLWQEGRKIALALLGLGIEPGSRISILSPTRIDWVTTDLGILAAGCVTVPIYPSSMPDECQYIADHAGVKVIFADDATQVAKLLQQKAGLAAVVKVVQLTGEVADDHAGWILSLPRFLAGALEDDGQRIEARMATLQGESILTIIYTSGTTGRPKGVVLTHANMLYEGEAVQRIGILGRDDIQLLFLPLAHVFAKVLEISWFSIGHVMAFAEDMTTIKQNLGEVRPTIMCGVPRVFEKFYSAVVEKGSSATGLKLKLFQTAMTLSQRHGEAEERGESLGVADRIKFAVLSKLVFAKIGAGVNLTLGGRMRLMLSGGAPLSKKIGWFFRDAGLTVVEGYGLTESSAATCVSLPRSNQIGTVGPVVPGTELRIAADGEILIRGPGVMREYWKNTEATAEALDGERWLHTGDIGEVDPRTNCLRITDRKKDIIVTAGGKNVAPQKIENLLKNHKLISQAVVHGDRRKFLSALFTLDPINLQAFSDAHRLTGDYAALTQHPQVGAEVQRIVDETNAELASYESVKRFKILDQDFSIETGELTPKLSIKRKVVSSRFGHIFDGFYEERF